MSISTVPIGSVQREKAVAKHAARACRIMLSRNLSRLSFPEIAYRTWRNGNVADGSNGRFQDRALID